MLETSDLLKSVQISIISVQKVPKILQFWRRTDNIFCINVSTLNMSPNAHCYNKEQSNIISVDKQRHLYKCQQWMNTSPITHRVVNKLLRHWLMMTSLMSDDVIIHIQRKCMCTFPARWFGMKIQSGIFPSNVEFDFSIQKSFLNLPFSILKWEYFTFLTFLEGNQFMKISKIQFFQIFESLGDAFLC